ncbi:MAG: AAA family ATPase [Sulfurimicrobium sp.]|jgi:type II secretory pathway predicted ATPase ExeA|nr:AAA family ATPase [Sulfurimicrobium sp.]
MYLAHFGLSQPPFRITAHTEFFFGGGNRGAILDALIYAIRQGEGIVKVSGEVGSGKTMLCRMLQERLPAEVETVYLANPSVSPDEILHAIAFEMQLSLPRDAERLEVMQALQEYLVERHAQGKQVVVFVEEAQSMPLETLEEIRLLSNLETQHYKLLQIVLFGQPELDKNLARTEIRQLKERITHSFTLKPLTAGEIRDYLMFRLRTANYHGPDLFGPAVVKLIARASRGLTRRVNIIADKTLLAAFADNTHTVSLKHVRAAIQDSEFELAAGSLPWPRLAAALLLLLFGVGLGAALHPFFQTQPREQEAAVGKGAALAAPSAQALAEGEGSGKQQAEATADPADIVAQRLAATENWLSRQGHSTSSIQLMGSNDLQQLRWQLAKMGRDVEMDQIFVYRTKINGRPAWTVLYGSFASRAEAAAALARLPETLKANRPVLRTLQGIRAEIAEHQR